MAGLSAFFKRNLKKLFLSFLILLLCLAAYAAYMLVINHRLSVEIAKIKAEGSPTTWEELNAYYETPPPGENAAGLYAKAFAKLSLSAFDKASVPLLGSAELPAPWEPLPENMLAASSKLVAENAEAIALLKEAAKFKKCRYPIEISAKLDTHCVPHISSARLLSLDSCVATEKGEAVRAVEDVSAILSLSSSLNGAPLIIFSLEQVYIEGIALSSLSRLVNRVKLGDQELKALQDSLANFESGFSMAKALAGERCFTLLSIDEPSFFDDVELLQGKSQSRSEMAFYVWSGMKILDATKWLDLSGMMVNASKRAPEDSYADFKRIDMKAIKPSLTPFTSILFSTLTDSALKFLTGVAKLRAAESALAVARFKAANGRLPNSLAELVPGFLTSVPLDPFDGKPMKFKKGVLDLPKSFLKAKASPSGRPAIEDLYGFVVYSVGKDEKDGGGKDCFDSSGYVRDEGDICFPVVLKP